MTRSERRYLERRLLEERASKLGVLAKMDERIELEAPGPVAEEAVAVPQVAEIEHTREDLDYVLAEKEAQLLEQINAALRKLYQQPEWFGVCEHCGSAIPFERLALVPWARLCMSCESKAGGHA